MNHLTEEQLVLYYYGEPNENSAPIEEHIGSCEQCRASYQALKCVLNSVDSFPVPEREPDYENRVWRSVEGRLGKRPLFAQWMFGWRRSILAAAVAILVVAAFLAGRTWRKAEPRQTADNGVRERVLLVAVGDHLERSELVLVELANAGAPTTGRLDISYEQQTAEDLLESNRLYRQTAATNGDQATAAVLDELELVLLEIAHSPSEMSARQLESLRKQIEEQGILVKVKTYGSKVEQSTGSANSL